MDDHQIAVSANGKSVSISLMRAPTSQVISRNPHLLSLISEIVTQSNLLKPVLNVECDMKRPVGYCDIVAAADDAAVFYARQAKGGAFTRFIKGRKAEPTTIVSMRLEQISADSYSVTQVGLGHIPPAVPGSEGESAHSKDYWLAHAVVYNGQSILTSTVTKDCPYFAVAA